jgi:hypothetical protein
LGVSAPSSPLQRTVDHRRQSWLNQKLTFMAVLVRLLPPIKLPWDKFGGLGPNTNSSLFWRRKADR